MQTHDWDEEIIDRKSEKMIMRKRKSNGTDRSTALFLVQSAIL